MRSMCVGVAETGVEHCSPAKNHKVTFTLSYFCMTKSTKSQQGGLTPSSLKTSVRRARVSRASHAWQVRATKDKSKICGLAVLCGFSCTTRANKVHEIAEQIRARIVCTPAESARRGLTHMRSMCVGVAETGQREFSLCADGIEYIFFAFSVGYTWILFCIARRRRRPAW